MSKEQNDEFLQDDEMLMDDFSDGEMFSDDAGFEAEVEDEAFETGEGEFDEVPEDAAFGDVSAEGMEAAQQGFAETGMEDGTDGADAGLESALTDEEKPIMYRPPRMDLYTVLLFLSLLFVLAATALHYFECPPSEYGTVPFKKGSPVIQAPGM